MLYDFVVIGAGIAGCSISYFLRDKAVLLVDKVGICEKASNAAGAFLFPKVGYDTKYTRFVNKALLFSFDLYESLGIDTHKTGVLILPRDENDIEKFEKYKEGFRLPYEPKDGGFFFYDGGFVDSQNSCKVLTKDIPFKKINITSIQKEDYYILNGSIKTKNIILARGWEEIIDIEYIKIRPVWGQRIELKTSIIPKYNYHKNCSVSKNIDGIVKIGATHQRIAYDKEADTTNSNILIQKANEILEIDGEIYSQKAGLRAGSIDYFPIVGEVIDVDKTLKAQPNIKNGRLPERVYYKKGMYIINGGGGRGFSNYPYVAKLLSEYILKSTKLPKEIDSKRLFIKYARKL